LASSTPQTVDLLELADRASDIGVQWSRVQRELEANLVHVPAFDGNGEQLWRVDVVMVAARDGTDTISIHLKS
jgi:hypothetical protein